MANTSVTIEALKLKLKSATKLKLLLERELCQVRSKERSLKDQLTTEKAEIEFLKEQLEDVKTQISQAKHQISMVAICATSEKCKIEADVANLALHEKGFQALFDKGIELIESTKIERNLFEIQMKEIQEKEAEEKEILRQKEREVVEANEEQAREAAAVEAECENLERECVVLRKRNNAIMLQLRHKLLETENARRELAKRKTN